MEFIYYLRKNSMSRPINGKRPITLRLNFGTCPLPYEGTHHNVYVPHFGFPDDLRETNIFEWGENCNG